MSHLFLTWVVFQVFGLALVSWVFARIGFHRLSLRLPYLVFSIRSYLPLDFNRFSSLQPTYRHPFGRPFILSRLGEFPGLGLALIPDVVVSGAEPRFSVWLSPIARILSRGNPLGSAWGPGLLVGGL